ncbi:unnamed protein product [Phaeothamnion confervicola]
MGAKASPPLPPTFVKGFHEPDVVRRMPYRPLGRTGLVVSAIGFGGSSVGGSFGPVEQADARHAVKSALLAGINYIDCPNQTAPWYGDSEVRLGEALADVPREAFLIATKVGRYAGPIEDRFNFSADRVKSSVLDSLRRLKLPYVDVIQVHDVEFAPSLDVILEETLPALQELKDLGLVRFIGVTGYPLGPLEEMVRRSRVPVDLVLSYCRHTLADDALSRSPLLALLVERGVGVVNAGAVAMGLLAPGGPPPWHPAGETMWAACAEVRELCRLAAAGTGSAVPPLDDVTSEDSSWKWGRKAGQEEGQSDGSSSSVGCCDWGTSLAAAGSVSGERGVKGGEPAEEAAASKRHPAHRWDIATLAVRRAALSDPRIHTTLIGTASSAQVAANVAAVCEPPTPAEAETSRAVMALLRERLGPGGGAWEGTEVSEYWRATGARLALRHIYRR